MAYTGLPFRGNVRPPRPWRVNVDSPQADGLVAWWNPSRVDGARFGAVTSVGGSGIGTDSGVAVQFVGSNTSKLGHDEIAVGAVGYPFTLCAWARLDTQVSYAAWITYSSTRLSNDGARIGFSTDTSMRITYGGVADYNSGNTITAGVWYHVAAVFTGNGASTPLYLNGSNIYNATVGTIGGTPAVITVNGNYYTDGDATIADARLYSRALSAEQVYHLFAPQTRWDLYAPV